MNRQASQVIWNRIVLRFTGNGAVAVNFGGSERDRCILAWYEIEKIEKGMNLQWGKQSFSSLRIPSMN